MRRVADREANENVAPLHLIEPDPDYSNMSAEDAKNYGLAAKEADPNIGHDELPHEP
ncbi:hypothetical protein GCM10017709_00610 [Glutamicibacter nicotianae]